MSGTFRPAPGPDWFDASPKVELRVHPLSIDDKPALTEAQTDARVA